MLDEVIDRMRLVFAELPPGVSHTLRVLQNARDIASLEQLDESIWQVVLLAAVLHDIGVPSALAKHGSLGGSLQELEGPPVAREILDDVGAPAALADRVCYIVGNHHTRSRVDGRDFEVLWDADAMDDLEFGEDRHDRERCLRRIRDELFTESGRKIAIARIGCAG